MVRRLTPPSCLRNTLLHAELESLKEMQAAQEEELERLRGKDQERCASEVGCEAGCQMTQETNRGCAC